MPANPTGARRSNRRRRFDLDDPSQSSVLLHVLALLVATGVVAALTLGLLAHRGLLGGDTLAEALPIVLVSLAGVVIFSILVAIPLVLRLTHRYVGPALVMRRALEGMRIGEYGCRLSLRRHDYLKSLAREIEAHRSDIARRDVAHARLVQGVRQRLDEGDLIAARVFMQWYGAGVTEEAAEPRHIQAKAG